MVETRDHWHTDRPHPQHQGEERARLDRLLGPRLGSRLGLVAQADCLFHGSSADRGSGRVRNLIYGLLFPLLCLSGKLKQRLRQMAVACRILVEVILMILLG